MRKIGLFILALLFVTASCHRSKVAEREQPDAAAIHYVQCMADEKYDEFISGMISCDSASTAYKKNMTILFKQMVAAKKEEQGGLKSVSCVRTELTENGKYANTFLKVTYSNDSSEIMLLPLIWQDEKWRMR
jgi:hypothetical protein